MLGMISWLYFFVGTVFGQGLSPCGVLAGKKTVTVNEAIRCYMSLPLSKTTQASQLDTLEKTLQFYAFLDISKKAPEMEVPSSIDLVAQIQAMKQRSFRGAYDMHQAIRSLFVGNNDGHTMYSSPCFEQFMFRQPFPLMAAENVEGRQIIRIVEDIVMPDAHADFWLQHGIDVREFEGAEVHSIDSWPVLVYLNKFGDKTVGVSRDPNTRLSLSLSHPIRYEGEWAVTYGIHMGTKTPPLRDYITYVLTTDAGVRSIDVPYLVTVPKSFKPGSDYYSLYCRPGRAAEARSSVADKYEHQEVQEILEMTPDAILPPPDRRIGMIKTPDHDGEFSQAYILRNKAAVLSLSSFSTNNRTMFYNDIKRSLAVINNAKKLVIDLSNNGGGVICFGYHVLDAIIQTPRFPTDFRLTPLLSEMVSRSFNTDTFLDPRYWAKPDGTEFQSAAEFLTPRRFARGRSTNSLFTQPFIDNCPPNPLPLGRRFKPKDIAIVSNGICFSTCALVANALQEHHGIKSYVVGGDQNRPATVATLAGGTIYTLNKLQALLRQTNLQNHPDAPRPFAIDAEFTFTIREAYSNTHPQNPTPLEFKWFPANTHLKSTFETFNYPSIVWDAIATKLHSAK
ncbi:hypothetical protein DSO57_1010853 [Entomophthora muscae]|uniref:Uncharacterized protein n=1 Tax=Entomophthora muscae TaxID=34485 RepID=A0ACC2RXD4_9FUNG|nr:hypothetical protein DSO57_1010853 [Entomophthora muscae]